MYIMYIKNEFYLQFMIYAYIDICYNRIEIYLWRFLIMSFTEIQPKELDTNFFEAIGKQLEGIFEEVLRKSKKE